MKRKAAALTLISALIVTLSIGVQIFEVAKANPFPTHPVITIESPANKTYTTNQLSLNVTLVTQWDGVYFTSESRAVSYHIDGKFFLMPQIEYRFDPEKEASILSGSAVLTNLTEGTHTLRVDAAYSYDNGKQVFASNSNVTFTIDPNYSPSLSPSPSPSPTATPSTTPTPQSTSTPEPEQETFPILPVSAVTIIAIAIVATGLLVYFKRRRNNTWGGI